jgi:5,10-methenyltetrahydromethanopterin hydrogenase
MIKESLTKIRNGILDFEDALAERVRALFITEQVETANLVSTAFNGSRDLAVGAVYTGFALVRGFVGGVFSLVRATTVVVIGDYTDSLTSLLVNPADYNAGFDDGRLGMVSDKAVKNKKVTKNK